MQYVSQINSNYTMDKPSRYQPINTENPEGCMARHSMLAYRGHRELADVLQKAGFERVLVFTARASNAYLGKFPHENGSVSWILSFRGTENDYKDILYDITLFKRTADYDHGYRVHGGFLTALQNIWGSWGRPHIEKPEDIYERVGPKGISEIIGENVNPEDRFFVTGHSLGGAMGQLAAYYIDRDLPVDVTALYTFGAPRVLDRDMAKKLNQQKPFPEYRFVNASDIVPRVPPYFLGFRHAAKEIYISKNGKVYRQPGVFRKFKDVWMTQIGMVVLFAMLVFGLLEWSGWIGIRYWNMLIAAGAGFVVLLAITRLIKMLPYAMLRRLKFRAFADHGIQKYVDLVEGNRKDAVNAKGEK